VFYLICAIMFDEMGVGIRLPVGDLSAFWQKRGNKEDHAAHETHEEA